MSRNRFATVTICAAVALSLIAVSGTASAQSYPAERLEHPATQCEPYGDTAGPYAKRMSRWSSGALQNRNDYSVYITCPITMGEDWDGFQAKKLVVHWSGATELCYVMNQSFGRTQYGSSTTSTWTSLTVDYGLANDRAWQLVCRLKPFGSMNQYNAWFWK